MTIYVFFKKILVIIVYLNYKENLIFSKKMNSIENYHNHNQITEVIQKINPHLILIYQYILISNLEFFDNLLGFLSIISNFK